MSVTRLVGAGFREVIGEALRIVPARLRPLVECDWFCGADPIFAGMATDDTLPPEYRDLWWSTWYPWHIRGPADRRQTTIIMPTPDGSPLRVIHELGHVLDERLGFSHRAEPVSEYAETNRMEAFAEAFCGWLFYGYKPLDPATEWLLDGLTA